MKPHRIFGITLRYLYGFRHSWDRLTDVFYWPAMDLFLWGLTSTYIRLYAPHASNIVLMIVSGLLFWIIVWRAQYEITVNTLEEFWNKNLVNIFVSPLKFSEWICSFIIIGFIKGFISFTFAAILAFFLYGTGIFVFGWYLIPFFILLYMSGWAVGFLVAGIIIQYGTKIQTLAWAVVAVLAPFSAIYYPLSILPKWAQVISYAVPTSYVFEGGRSVLATGHTDVARLLISFALNIIYIACALTFFHYGFKKVFKKGLASVY